MNKIEANDPTAQSADIVADNLSQLQSLFPEAFTEGKVQFDILRQLLGGAVDEADEKYGLNRLLKYFRLQSTAPACEPLCSEPPQIYWRPEHARSRHLHREPVHAQPA